MEDDQKDVIPHDQVEMLPADAVHHSDVIPDVANTAANAYGLQTLTPAELNLKDPSTLQGTMQPYQSPSGIPAHEWMASTVAPPIDEMPPDIVNGQTMEWLQNATPIGSVAKLPGTIISSEAALAAKGLQNAPAAVKMGLSPQLGGANTFVQPTAQNIAESALNAGQKAVGWKPGMSTVLAEHVLPKAKANHGKVIPKYADGGLADPMAAVPTPVTGNAEEDLAQEEQQVDLDARGYAGGGVVDPSQVLTEEEQYSTPGQQVKAGLEGVAKGVVGPLAPLAEKAMGVKPEDILKREEHNPVTSAAGEGLGFAGSMMVGTGAGAAASKLGKAAELASGLGKAVKVGEVLKEAPVISKIAASGVRTGAEMAGLQASDEVSKMILNDPNQSLGSAAINVGLSGLMGGALGVGIGTVSPLWKAASTKAGLPELIDNAKAQYDFRVKNPDMHAGAMGELASRHTEMEALRSEMSNLKGEALAQVIPAQESLHTPKINAQMSEIVETFGKKLEAAEKSAKTRSAVPYLSEDLENFSKVALDPNTSNLQKFNSLNDLKRTLDGYQKFTESVENTARGRIAQELQTMIRPALENPKVWGEAGNLQKNINKAIFSSIKSEEDLLSKFTSKQMGQRVVDPNKVMSYLNQTTNSRAGLKTSILKNYLEKTQELADTIGKIHTDVGLEKPLSSHMNPTPVLNRTLGEVNQGTHLGNWLFENGLANAAGSTAASSAGGVLGSLVGHPYLGASAGQYLLSPLFKSIAKPLLEKASNAGALKSSVDFVSSVIKGQKLLGNATKSFFRGTSDVLPKAILPDAKSRAQLEKSIDSITQNPNNAMKIGGNIGHYLPDHQSAVAALSASAQSYLNALKPVQPVNMPLDSLPPESKIARMTYERQLDIAQQPLLVLKYAKEGTLMPLDVKTLTTIYPSLHKTMVDSLSQELIQAKSEGHYIPYSKRQSLSLLMGKPLDSTMTPASMQAIIGSVRGIGGQQPGAPSAHSKQSHGASGATISQMNKVNSLYQTSQQSREAKKHE